LKIYTAGPLGFSQAGSAFHNDALRSLILRNVGGRTYLTQSVSGIAGRSGQVIVPL
jgi:hypothetical protein